MKHACKACGRWPMTGCPFQPPPMCAGARGLVCASDSSLDVLLVGTGVCSEQGTQTYLSLQNPALLRRLLLREILLQLVLLLQVQRLLQEQHVGALLDLLQADLGHLLLMLPQVPVLALSQRERLGRRAHLQVGDGQVDFLVLAQDVLVEFVVAEEGVVEVVAEGQQVGGVELPLVISELVP